MRIPTDRPEHYVEALQKVRPVASKWPTNHPIQGWIKAAEWCAAGKKAEPIINNGIDQSTAETALEYYITHILLPAVRLCRLGRTLKWLKQIAGAEEELTKMAQPHHFFHGEYALHLAVKIWHDRRCEVRFVPTRGGRQGSTPDLEIPAQRFCIECRAHEEGNPRQPLTGDFAHASGKFTQYLGSNNDWTGVLAVDLGNCGSPTLPNLLKPGRSIPMTTEEIRGLFPSHPLVRAVLLTWNTIELEEQTDLSQLVPKLISGLIYAPSSRGPLSILSKTFRPWIDAPDRIALRSR